jgi:hypothetical protein
MMAINTIREAAAPLSAAHGKDPHAGLSKKYTDANH